MPSPANYLPVYTAHEELMYYVTAEKAQKMLDQGQCVGKGTARRIRALIAVHDNVDLIPSATLRLNDRYSFKGESSDNPPGVWTFKKLRPLT